MTLLKKIKPLAIITFTGGICYLGYEVYETFVILNRAIDTSVIDVTEPRPEKFIHSSKRFITIQPINSKSPSIIDRFWDKLSFAYSRRLINIAKSDDRNCRQRAVDALSRIKTLDDWHYSLLAHMLDAQTAVGLARTENADLKFFLNPPNRYVYYNHVRIVSWMKHFLMTLDKCSNHPCVGYFINKIFINPQDVGRMIEHDISSVELKPCIQSIDDILPLCVDSILHHSTIQNHARDIVQNNGLPLLMELYKRYKENNNIVISLVKIIANISIYPELLQDIYRSGWVGVLAKLIKNEDIRISGPAARALANLDNDDDYNDTYARKIYLLYPMYRSNVNRDVDVILVHGLLGGVFFTWRQRDRKPNCTGFLETISPTSESCLTSDPATQEYIHEIEEQKQTEWNEIGKDFEFIYHDCPRDLGIDGPYSCPGECLCSEMDNYSHCWPKDWLPQTCPNLRILGINYETKLSFWTPMCPIDKINSTLEERSDDFLDKLVAAGVGKKPIIWLTHSMGGLLVKNILVNAWNNKDERVKKICGNTKGIVFYSTPHKGTHAASLSQTTSLLVWPSIEVRELKADSPKLIALHKKFMNLTKNMDFKILSFVETESTIITPLKLQFHFVPEHSAKLDYGEYYEIPLDHLGICKPCNKHSFLYQKVVLFIKEIINDCSVSNGKCSL